ncbi:hypothetical protein [Allokutzneria oryzae]|uniref:Uncharacterized protein n=1 Tax=Allokutzneria oryzae TaxID=1378989 RepID=A0ABV6AAG2_9PSEU
MVLAVKGITYRVDDIPPERAGEDMRVIREGLRCGTVVLDGADLDRQLTAAMAALEAGLDVWVQPNLADRPHAEVLANLARRGRGGAAARRVPRAGHAHRGLRVLVAVARNAAGPREFVRLQVLMRWWFFDRGSGPGRGRCREGHPRRSAL